MKHIKVTMLDGNTPMSINIETIQRLSPWWKGCGMSPQAGCLITDYSGVLAVHEKYSEVLRLIEQATLFG